MDDLQIHKQAKAIIDAREACERIRDSYELMAEDIKKNDPEGNKEEWMVSAVWVRNFIADLERIEKILNFDM